MYKSNSNFGAGCPNWANWADLRFGFVYSTDIIEQNKSVYRNKDTSTHIWWIRIEYLFLNRNLTLIPTYINIKMKFRRITSPDGIQQRAGNLKKEQNVT